MYLIKLITDDEKSGEQIFTESSLFGGKYDLKKRYEGIFILAFDLDLDLTNLGKDSKLISYKVKEGDKLQKEHSATFEIIGSSKIHDGKFKNKTTILILKQHLKK